MRKILLPLLLLLSLLMIIVLPSSLDVCIPDGCSFSGGVCGSNYCVNETLSQHLSERTQLFNATINFQQFTLLAIISMLLFVIKRYLEDGKIIATGFYVKQKLLNSSGVKLFNYLIEAFSGGIIHPQIYNQDRLK